MNLPAVEIPEHHNIDVPWTEVFQTNERLEVELFCAANDITCEWKDDGQLRTTLLNPAVVNHPISGGESWFNQAHLFHISSLEPEMRAKILASYNEADLPRNTYFGDGSPIDESDLDIIRALYKESTIRFDWQQYNLMLLDNMLFTHSRESYTGERKVLTGMA
ncbi:TauD/TfdA family dioxygenase [Colwellia psychrerythraea]|uniref:Taurine catabolism dioxygenase TauD/TfdA n=1 Tax=Colwellia psychrerythraea TaxID=28229 RepID=A0A099K7N4_COLPS|nr:TauD/TfdA family dioxygenase [Colwellia psychrerythraea]KGJ86789.1 Taurine catabolism dioxygenase TauD/TfdA [Colwellia psychrerythraea]